MPGFQEQLTIVVTADATGATQVFKTLPGTIQGDLQKTEAVAAQSGSKAGAGYAQNFSDGAKGAITALQAAVAGFGAIQLISFGKSSISDAVEYQRVNASLQAALQGVGSASGVTAAGVDHLSQRIQAQDAIWQGDTKAAATLLLTMQNISNQAGEGNEIFNRTLSLTAAISNVTGKDITSVATQIGRALENPAAGLQALSRSGIPLSAELKAQVLELAKRGDVLGAQKLLLDDLETRFLEIGAAAAKADPLQQFSVSMKQFKVQVGEDLVPAAKVLLSTMADGMKIFEEIPQPIRGATEAVIAFTVAAIALNRVFAVVGNVNAAAKTVINGGQAGTNAQAAAGSTGVSDAQKVEATSANEAAAATASLNEELATMAGTTKAASGGVAQMTGQLALFAEDDLAVGASVGAVNEQLALFGETGAVVAERVATTGQQLTLFAEENNAAAAAVLNLDEQLQLFDTSIATLPVTLAAVSAEEEASVGILGRLSTAYEGLGASLGTIATGVGGLLILGGIMDNLGKKAPDVEKLAAGINTFAKSGQIEPGSSLDTALQEAGAVSTHGLSYLRAGKAEDSGLAGLPGIHQGVETILGFAGVQSQINTAKDAQKNLDAGLAELVDQGKIQEANNLFQKYGQQLEATTGVPFKNFMAALKDWTAQQEAANGPAKDAIDILGQQAQAFQDLQTKYDIKSGLDAVKSAQQQVKSDYADIAGTSAKAKEADKAELDAKRQLADAYRAVDDANQSLTDSYHGVTDAQYQATQATQGLIDAQHALTEAQQAYDNYNSARGQHERALQADIIDRRVTPSPGAEDQKQLDILKLQDDNAQKEQELSDKVHSAQEGVAQATHAVEAAYYAEQKAQDAVGKAEQRVQDATYRVQAAQDSVTAATQKRADVSANASARIKTDIDKEQTALLAVVTKLQDAAAQGNINATDAANWVTQLQNVADKMNGPVSSAVDDLATKVKALGGLTGGVSAPTPFPYIGPYSQDTYTRLRGEAAPGFKGPITESDRLLLHQAGIPGYDLGGLVSGSLGAPQLAIVHGGERVLTPQQQRQYGGGVTVQQTNHFNGNAPTEADLEYANTQLGWRLSRAGRY